MLAELAENATVYNLLSLIKNCQIFKSLCYSVWLKARKTLKFCFPRSELYLVRAWGYSILGKEKVWYSCIVDWDWRKCRLPCLDRVLQCLVGVSVLGSQVFGQALMEGCEYPAVNTGELAGVGSVAVAVGVSHMQQVTYETWHVTPYISIFFGYWCFHPLMSRDSVFSICRLFPASAPRLIQSRSRNVCLWICEFQSFVII